MLVGIGYDKVIYLGLVKGNSEFKVLTDWCGGGKARLYNISVVSIGHKED